MSTNDQTTGGAPTDDASSLRTIAARVQSTWRDVVAPIGARFAFEAGPSVGEVGGPPTVLLVGNHSSGKSTFINHLLGETVQTTGLAPTDDSFTILSHAAAPADRDGRAVVSDPDLPWDGLAAFGPTLLSHLNQKARAIPLLERVTIVDSPGMIDAGREDSGRGYDFAGVVRWFAERADLVLLFFDPDKPGTTGETLDVYTRALEDLGHKLRVVMNKVDQFRSIPDFARAYGALCWNLAKVSPRKDLPRIYTSYVPVPGAPAPGLPTKDFQATRQELETAVRDAPALRVHNLVTRLHEHGERLRTHARVVDAASRELRSETVRGWAAVGLAGVIGAAAVAVSVLADGPPWLWASLAAATAIGIVVGRLLVRRTLRRTLARLVDGLDASFERVFGGELLARDRADDLHARWQAVRARTRRTLETLGPDELPRLRRRERKDLDAIVEREVPALRREIGAAAARPRSEEAPERPTAPPAEAEADADGEPENAGA